MKIKLVHWPINNIGGILTWIRAIREGFEALGHEVDVVCPVDHHPKAKEIVQDDYAKGVPACRMLPVVTDLELTRAMETLNSADLVVFCHPSPHPTKDQLKKAGDGRRWVEIYQRLEKPRLVVFHDNNWEKTNAWFADVKDSVPFILAAQHIFVQSVARYPAKNGFVWDYFPMTVPPLPEAGRRSGGLMATQWLGWKRHMDFIRQHAAALKTITTFDFYNGGIEYFYTRKESFYQENVGDPFFGDGAELEALRYRGPVPHDALLAAMGRALFCVDYSKRGYVNYTHWEPLLCGAYSFVHEDVRRNEFCELPESAMVVPFTDDNIVERIKAVLDTDPVQERRDVYAWCKERMEPVAVCGRILGHFEAGKLNAR